MKKLILLLLLPVFAQAQIYDTGTLQRNRTDSTVRGNFGSRGLMMIPTVSTLGTNGQILVFDSATNKYVPTAYTPVPAGLADSLTKKANRTFDNVASGAIAKAKVDTTATGIQTVSNFFPKGDTRWLKTSTASSTYLPLAGGTMTGNIAMNNVGDQWFQSVAVTTAGRKGLKLSNGSNIDMKISTGGNQTLGAFTESDNLMVYGTGYQGGGGGNEKHLWHSTGKGNMFAIDANASMVTSFFPITAPSFIGNASSATSLATNRTIWGQNFNGTANVSGALTGVTGITTSGGYTQSGTSVNTFSGIGLFNNSATVTLPSGQYGAALSVGSNAGGYYYRFGLDASANFHIYDNDGTTSRFRINQGTGIWRYPATAGGGIKLIISDNNGDLTTAAIGSGLSYSAGVLTATGGSAGTINGSGTAGYLTKFTGSGTVGNSILVESGSTVTTSGYLGASSGFYGNAIGSYMLPITNGWEVQSASATNSFYRFKTSSGTLRGSVGATSSGVVGLLNTSDSFVLYSDMSGNATAVGTISATNFSGSSSGTNTGDQNLSGYAPLASPALTGSPTAPTQTAGDNSTKIATTAYVDAAVSGGTSGTYTPTLTNVANGSALSVVGLFNYTRIGDIITIDGKINFAANGTAIIQISLPPGLIPNFGFTSELYGSGVCWQPTVSSSGNIYADPTTDTAEMICTGLLNATTNYSIHISYDLTP